MNKSGYFIISLSLFSLITIVSGLIFSYQFSSLKLLNAKKVLISHENYIKAGKFSVLKTKNNNIKYINLDYNLLFKNSYKCIADCEYEKIAIRNSHSFLGNLNVRLLEIDSYYLAASGKIQIEDLNSKSDLIILAFKDIKIKNIDCNGNRILVYSLLGQITVNQYSNCLIQEITTENLGSRLKLSEYIITRVIY